jgi:hypothetical protein
MIQNSTFKVHIAELLSLFVLTLINFVYYNTIILQFNRKKENLVGLERGALSLVSTN